MALLHKLMLWNTNDSSLYKNLEEFYSLFSIVCYAAIINEAFARVTDMRSGQLDFLATQLDGPIENVQSILAKAMEKVNILIYKIIK